MSRKLALLETNLRLTAVALAVLAAVAPAVAQQVRSSDIVAALRPDRAGPAVRSLTTQAARGIAIEGVLPTDLDLPKIDLTVNFEFDSARLTVDAMLVLRALGAALADPALKGGRFQIAGHTDAKGTDAYNFDLSRRRAAAVVEHLQNFHGVEPGRLVAVGYGESQLLYPQSPENELNRRVTIVNVGPLAK